MNEDYILETLKKPVNKKIWIVSGLLGVLLLTTSGLAIAFTMNTKAPTTPVTNYHLEDDYASLDISVSYDEQKYTVDYTNKTEYHMYWNHFQNAGSFDETYHGDTSRPDWEINWDDMDTGWTHSNSNVDISIIYYYLGDDNNTSNSYFVDLNNNGFLDEGETVKHSYRLTINWDIDQLLYNNEVITPI